MKKLKVIELFAGVGGFRLGLVGYNGKSASSNYKKKLPQNFEIVWSNQYEPSTKIQSASEIYEEKFKDNNHSREDIGKVKLKDIPDHDVLVGGFPCQDYSVANSLRTAGGILGKKGVLWWEIERIINKKKPKYLILENVDRLLKSPASQRGKDFAVMLACLNDHGYAVEWRVINAADFGFPQRRKRVFIVAYLDEQNRNILKNAFKHMTEQNFDALAIEGELDEISKKFGKREKKSPFQNSGISVGRKVFTSTLKYSEPILKKVLGDIIEKNEVKINNKFYVGKEELNRWKEVKGAKKIPRVSKSGYKYIFKEGSMTFPDDLNKAARTIITSEGGKSPSRFKHIIKINNKYRRLVPSELEQLNMFPKNFTSNEESSSKRAFFMGNALVVGVVEMIGKALYEDYLLNNKT